MQVRNFFGSGNHHVFRFFRLGLQPVCIFKYSLSAHLQCSAKVVSTTSASIRYVGHVCSHWVRSSDYDLAGRSTLQQIVDKTSTA